VKELLATFARALVDEPDRVRVDEYDGGELLELSVADADRGAVIGRRGRTADALRTLLDAAARRRGRRCELEILG
jgi:predicted RNA-binding protein YlqC (UPF0109 family)